MLSTLCCIQEQTADEWEICRHAVFLVVHHNGFRTADRGMCLQATHELFTYWAFCRLEWSALKQGAESLGVTGLPDEVSSKLHMAGLEPAAGVQLGTGVHSRPRMPPGAWCIKQRCFAASACSQSKFHYLCSG